MAMEKSGGVVKWWNFGTRKKPKKKMAGNGGFLKWCTPKSSILIGFSIINHPFWGNPIFGNTQMKHGDFLEFLWVGFNHHRHEKT